MEPDREERIRARAYDIWEREGREEGSHLAHWEQAENEIREEDAQGQEQPGESSRSDEAGRPSTSTAAGGALPEDGREGDADASARARRNHKKP